MVASSVLKGSVSSPTAVMAEASKDNSKPIHEVNGIIDAGPAEVVWVMKASFSRETWWASVMGRD